jgi:DnaJ-class molecular chaperone
VNDEDLERIATDLVLETRCPQCEGRGGHMEPGQWCYCPECEGSGHRPTVLGRRVLTLMRHNFKLMFDRYRDE